MRHGIGRARRHRTQQQGLRAVPAISVKGFNPCCGTATSGVAEEDVQAAKVRGRQVDRRLELGQLRDITLRKTQRRTKAFFERPARQRLHVGSNDPRAFFDEQFGGRQPDARRRTGDDRDLALQTLNHVSP